MALYAPDQGVVSLDGADVAQFDPADLRRSIGYVSQDVRLFYGTLRDNIALGDPTADDTAVLEAARISGLEAMVADHPQGFDMIVPERGEGLSGGQRQAIGIARALLKAPPLLLMDEATARRAVVRAPMRGTIKNVRINTVGGVIQPGRDIMEIVPLEDRLLVEARIRPSDVAFLRPGLPATVKITAYDYSVYGGLEGELEYISADTIVEERGDGEAFYRVRVRTAQSHLQGKHGPLPIIAGMTATVEVLTGHKTVLEYILKPFIKTRDSALRER